MSGPDVPETLPEKGEQVLVRYHTPRGIDKAIIGEVVDVEKDRVGCEVTVDKDPFSNAVVNTDTFAVRATWTPEDDNGGRLGILKVLRGYSGDAPPDVDREVSRFNSVSSLACGECGNGGAVVESKGPTCSKCGARIEMKEAQERREELESNPPPEPEKLESGPNELGGHRIGVDPDPFGRDYVCLDCGKRHRWFRIFRFAECNPEDDEQ